LRFPCKKIFQGIDLTSDTATLPTVEMKEAMFNAVLGDEQKHEDPTTQKLEDYVAFLLGQDWVSFLSSATMANIIAINLLCQPGDELIVAEKSHIITSEGGGPAIHSGVLIKPIKTQTGIFSDNDLRNIYRWSKSLRYPLQTCLSIENTTNLGGYCLGFGNFTISIICR